MQNMERFFGFKVRINSDLDPEDEAILRARATEIVDVEKIDLSEYYVYLHQLVIKAKEDHFNIAGGLSQRIKKLNIEFHVNEKQRRNNDIRFMNHIIKTGVPEEVRPYFQPDWIGYDIPVGYFAKTSWFQNAIIAFVRKEMRSSHKKIKVIVTTEPTSSFEAILQSKRSVDAATQLDLRFEGSVQLKLPLEGNTSMSDDSKSSSMIFNNYGTVGAFGTNASANDFVQNSAVLNEFGALANHARSVGQLEEAEKIEAAIDAMKQKKTMKAIEYLKKFGGWTLETANKLGMVAASEAIKSAISS